MPFFYIDVITFLLMACLAGVTFWNYHNKRLSDFYFTLMTLLVAISAAFDGATLLLDGKASSPHWALLILHMGYLISHLMTAHCFLIYTIVLTDTRHKIKRSTLSTFLLHMPALALDALIVLSGFIPIIFSVSAMGVYTHARLFFLMYVVSSYYLVWGIGNIIRYRTIFTKVQLIALLSYIPLVQLFVVIQFLFPMVYFEILGSAIGLGLLYVIVQHSETTIHIASQLRTTTSFSADTRRALKVKKPMEMVFIQVRNYRAIRNTMGNSFADRLLHVIAEEIREVEESLKIQHQVLGYYLQNGQFCLIVEERKNQDVYELARRVNTLVNGDLNNGRSVVRLVGNVVTLHVPKDIDNHIGLLAFQEELLNLNRRNIIVEATQLLESKEYRLLLKMDGILDEALRNNSFDIYYQPIYSSKENRFTQAEALVRLHDPEFGFIPLDMIMRSAEKTSNTARLDNAVLRQVCFFIASGVPDQLGIERIHTNLSISICNDNDMYDSIMAILDDYQVAPSRIAFDITDSTLAQAQNTFETQLKQLEMAGVQICVEEFGKGLSDFKRLTGMPVHSVKFAKDLMLDIGNARTRLLVTDLVNMFHHLGWQCIASGIEDERQRNLIAECEVEGLQGYYFSKPLSQKDFTNFVGRENAKPIRTTPANEEVEP